MANFIFNVALGSIRKRIQDGADIRILLLKAAGTDAALKDLNTIAEVLAEGSTTEADFTNYARVALTGLTSTVDDGNDSVNGDANDVVYSSAGGASNNSVTDAIIYEHVTNDADSIPLLQLDAVFTTDGNDVTLQMNASGFFTAS